MFVFLFLFYNEYSLCRYILGNYNLFTNDFLSNPHQFIFSVFRVVRVLLLGNGPCGGAVIGRMLSALVWGSQC